MTDHSGFEEDNILDKFIFEKKIAGKDQVLRLFACWCAKQLPPRDEKWSVLTNSAEKFATGQITEKKFTASYKDLGGSMSAASLIGVTHGDPSAAIFMAYGSTHCANAADAAIQAARWVRKYYEMIEVKSGSSPETISNKGKLLITQQIEMLVKINQE